MKELQLFVSLALIVTVLTSPGLPRADGPPGRYTVDLSGTPAVTDTVTGLVWMRNELNGLYMWDSAKAACSAVGAGWRLPNVMELTDLVDEMKASAPTIDATVFQGRTAGSAPTSITFWSSSSYALSAGLAWRVDFRHGNGDGSSVDGSNAVRCVR